MIGRGRAAVCAAIVMASAAGAAAQTLSEPPPPPPFEMPPAPSGPVVESALIVREAAFAVGPVTVRAPRVEIVGSTLSADQLAALLRPGEESAARRVARLDAKRIVAPEVIVDIETGGYRQTTTYRDLCLDDVAQGRVGRLAVKTVAVEGRGPGDDVSGEAEGLSVERVDVAATLALLFERAAPGASAVQLYGPFRLDRYAVASKDAAIDLRGFSGGAFRMRPGATPLVETLQAANLTGDATPQALAETFLLLRDLIAGMEMDGARADSVVVAPKTEDSGVARLDGVWLRDMREGRFSFGFESMKVTGKDATTEAKGFEVAGYDQTGLFDVLVKLARDPRAADDLNPLVLVPDFRRVALGSIFSCKPPREGCAAQNADVAVDGAALDRVPVAGGLDWRFDIGRFRTPASGAAPALDGTWRSRLEWRPQLRTLSLRETRVALAGYGEAALSYDLDNVLPGLFTDGRTAALMALTPVALRRATLRLADAGGVEKLVAAEAKAARGERPSRAAPRPAGGKRAARSPAAKPLSAKVAREALATRLERETLALGQAPAVRVLAEAIGAFVRDPAKPLSLVVAAQPPISALDVMGARAGSGAAGLLNRLSATTARE